MNCKFNYIGSIPILAYILKMFNIFNIYSFHLNSLLVYIIVTAILLLVLQYVSSLIKNIIIVKKNSYTEILSIYECGFDPFFFNTIGEFNVIFYRVSILFLLFDLELVLFFPWMLTYSILGVSSVLTVLLFVVLLFWGFFYEWFNGILDW